MSMKIVAGLGSIDDYPELVEAGADEFFIGYVPNDFISKYGRRNPINRREVIYYNVQIGSESELLILRDMIDKFDKPVSVALNSPVYSDEQTEDIASLVKRLKKIGFTSYIVANPKLIKILGDIEGIKLEVSGELGELNRGVIKAVHNKNVKRYIFPRQTTPSEMASLSSHIDAEFEAFALNEKCHFTGAYCNSYHADEMCHLCRVPYRLGQIQPNGNFKAIALAENEFESDESGQYEIGSTGCSICELWKLRRAGVTHLKIVSRGNASDITKRDIVLLKEALDCLYKAENEAGYIKTVKEKLFHNGCSGNCYRY